VAALNSNVVAELERLQKGLKPRADLWQITFDALGNAEREAWDNFQNNAQADGVYLDEVGEAAFGSITVADMPAPYLLNYFRGPLNQGLTLLYELFWKTERHKPAYVPRWIREMNIASFQTVQSFMSGGLRQVALEAGRAAQYVANLKTGLSFHDAEHAILVMLNSPAFFPPKPAQAKTLAMSLEWNFWQHYVVKAAEFVEMNPHATLRYDKTFKRLQEIGWGAVIDFSGDSSDVIGRLKTWAVQQLRTPLNIDLRFPPMIIGFINAGVRLWPHWKELLDTPRVTWSDAGI